MLDLLLALSLSLLELCFADVKVEKKSCWFKKEKKRKAVRLIQCIRQYSGPLQTGEEGKKRTSVCCRVMTNNVSCQTVSDEEAWLT